MQNKFKFYAKCFAILYISYDTESVILTYSDLVYNKRERYYVLSLAITYSVHWLSRCLF
ncbi:Uncharacterised protein [Avibacterium paragallinarum]|uniref:Uncharacterized protein n=1 Tax=Avibacterium paragallinarum TaxID=728 RepID=A0A377I4U9_AVIPA|nr:Uncharacterised protein [Avibacterium paragallinarum]